MSDDADTLNEIAKDIEKLLSGGVEVTDEQISALSLRRHQFHGEWNYDILARPV